VYVGDGPTGVTVGEGALWVTNSAGATVSRVSPDTMRIVQPYNVGNGPGGLTVARGGVWVANRLDGTVSRIDPKTNAVTAVPTGGGASGVAASDDAIWVANEFDGTISRIDTTTRETRTISVGNAPSGLAVHEDTLWVTVHARSSSHRGGTLRVVSDRRPQSIDMAVAYDLLAWQLFVMTNDGLVGFRKVSGAEGSLLVPDLATSLPTPTDGGRTYTFQVRPDIRYSTGALVRPEDFRRAIERVYTTGTAGTGVDDFPFYDGILGSDECRRDPRSCDLSQGIQTSRGTVTFRLEKPDPDFLYKLAMPWAYAVPSQTGGSKAHEPLPATGPYMFETYDRNGVVLVRNPQFRGWSPVAQPDGYPDRVVWRFGIEDKEAIHRLMEGDLDWVFASDGRLSGLTPIMQEAPELLHSYPDASVFYMSLNTTKPPFDDVRVRQALNFAVDRSKVAELWGGPDRARTTCQVLPPGFPGYRPYCPYTMDPDAGGRWTAPDLARAQQLIRRSGAEGTSVEVWGFPVPGGVGLKIVRYFTTLLDTLGFRATERSFSGPDTYFNPFYREKPQIGFGAWGQDYPAPSNFLDLLLSCGAPAGTTELCDARIDRMIDRALALQTVDPPRANALWAAVDRRIVDLAPWVSLLNPINVDVVSERVGNYQHNPQWGLLLDQLWVM
jgi:peptide/nickel transport system substrate-binding protein